MRCPFCHNPDSRVIDSRETDEGATTRRRRSCPGCGRRFTTVEEAVLAVVKRSGVSEPFARGKVVAGVRRACQGRPVDEDQLALLAQQVEDAVRATGCAEIPSNEVGLAILGPLRDLDEVAYLRFASVYRSFSSVADFEKEIAELRAAPARGAVDAGDGRSAEPGGVGDDQEIPAGGSPRRRAAERPRPADTGNAAGP
ncbi:MULTISPECIES: transcriptional regulator NrdR [unclassified Modestobacter]|uniref:transcriptional regulator NrdR n=1 Tax=unclassified Modestobacter TaxID=2643866 RepID=UPI0022AB241C|nr:MULTISPECIES: transcriptional regulator NrdR [unclassified Modestobacter]MCZ2826792.1 transcriptional regulator NrdR [Modestobacter sp. VKM Ac-2981]MCZ2855172.1 transcriptional regulator NrdR [Modestobacter sp. VKM Ac-2982]